MCKLCQCTHKLNKRPKDVYVKYLKFIILQCNPDHKNVLLHIPGLKIVQNKIPRNVDDFGTLTT
jgi:hypothetical protein